MKFLPIAVVAASMCLGVNSANADLMKTIKDKKEFTVGTEARFAPFEFVKDGKIVGYSADIMAEIMKEMPGVKLTRLDLPWQGILPGLAASRFDYVVTSVTVTPERLKAYHLSAPIADATMAVLVRANEKGLMKPADMAGKKVGSQAGSAQLKALEKFAATLDAKPTISTYTGFDEAYADLAAGRIDAVVNSLPNLLEAKRTRPDIFNVLADTFGQPTYFSWAGRKDADSDSLNAFMNAQILKLKASGKLAELQTKWFGSPMKLPDSPSGK